MKIIVLTENTTEDENLIAEHGLSLYIETNKHNILCDTGQTDAFIRNAAKLGCDLRKTDICILSHGHYDHCGGLGAFRSVNPDANIYINSNAFGDFFDSDGKYIGIDREIGRFQNLFMTTDRFSINDEIEIFSGVTGRTLFPFGNSRILKSENGILSPDDFAHEQYAVVLENGKRVLISGCAHNGIVNILERFAELYGGCPDAVVSGFHLMKRTPYNDAEIKQITDTADELLKYDTAFYTGHCTGAALPLLKEVMGDRLFPITTGKRIVI